MDAGVLFGCRTTAASFIVSARGSCWFKRTGAEKDNIGLGCRVCSHVYCTDDVFVCA
ncbi:MAG: short-chain fatty acyl-CoA regulator family protein [Opitutaceae bacterium]|nr:short-chain fatty acyl-CoA regulator family protein [Opitutaceae bacterium]